MEDLFGAVHCTKGCEHKCLHAKSKTCRCECGGRNHGMGRKEVEREAEKREKGELVHEEVFYANTDRKISGEIDFGVWWRDGRQWPTYRVSWIRNTGELYAFNQQTSEIEVLGVCKTEEKIEKRLNGWADVCGGGNSLDWVRSKF